MQQISIIHSNYPVHLHQFMHPFLLFEACSAVKPTHFNASTLPCPVSNADVIISDTFITHAIIYIYAYIIIAFSPYIGQQQIRCEVVSCDRQREPANRNRGRVVPWRRQMAPRVSPNQDGYVLSSQHALNNITRSVATVSWNGEAVE